MLIKKIARSTLGIKDHRVVKVTNDTEKIIIHLDRIHRRKLACSGCEKRRPVRDRLQERTWRHVPFWNIPVFLQYRPARVNCPTCGVKVEKMPWSNGKSCLSRPLSLTMATWARILPMDVVRKLFGVCWNAVYSAVTQAVEYGLANRDKSKAVILGIDEISRKKGHVYHTQIYDLVNKKLLASFPGRDFESLAAFFVSWGEENLKNIKGICFDMWDPYLKAVKMYCPQAILVFDKFHIVRHLLEAVNRVRKEEAARLKKTNPDILKGTRYLWLKNPWNLTDNQKDTLGYLEKLNLKINRAYLLKEHFRDFWTCHLRSEAALFLNRWFWKATHSRLEPMRSFAWMLRTHEEGILAYSDLPIDNGAVEAMNNNAKAISHKARGYRSSKTFSTILMHCLGGLDMPKLAHNFA
jgi:transposase